MKKTLKITLIIILCGFVLLLCGILGLALKGDYNDIMVEGTYETRENYTLVLEKEIDPQNISDLQVQYGMNSNDVFFFENTGNTILVKEYMNFTPEENQISTVDQKGTTLTITGKKRNSSSGFFFHWGTSSILDNRRAYTEIYLPADFYASLSVKTISGDIRSERDFLQGADFSAVSTSGDIYFPNVEAQEISLSSTSGDLSIQNMEASDIEVSTTSGDIMLTSVKGSKSVSSVSGEITLTYTEDNTSVSTTSGDVRILGGTDDYNIGTVSGEIRVSDMVGAFEISTTSGDLFIENSQGFGQASSVSGDMRIFLNELTGSLNIDTTSGDVDIKLPDTSAFALDFNSTSGDCSTFFDDVLSFNKKGTEAKGQYGVANGNTLMISTTSGNLRITENN